MKSIKLGICMRLNVYKTNEIRRIYRVLSCRIGMRAKIMPLRPYHHRMSVEKNNLFMHPKPISNVHRQQNILVEYDGFRSIRKKLTPKRIQKMLRHLPENTERTNRWRYLSKDVNHEKLLKSLSKLYSWDIWTRRIPNKAKARRASMLSIRWLLLRFDLLDIA